LEKADFYPEVEVPEKLPWRTYAFTFYFESETRKACTDHYTDLYDTDDSFINSNGLIVERWDGREMKPHEIRDLREAFYKDALEWFTAADAFYHWGIESVYFNKKLFFWKVKEKLYPNTLNEFKDNMLEMVKAIYGDPNPETEERRIDEILEGEMIFRNLC